MANVAFILSHINSSGDLVFNKELLKVLDHHSTVLIVNNRENNPDHELPVGVRVIELFNLSVSQARNEIIRLFIEDRNYSYYSTMTMIDGDDMVSESYQSLVDKYSLNCKTIILLNGTWIEDGITHEIFNDKVGIRHLIKMANWGYMYNRHVFSIYRARFIDQPDNRVPEDYLMSLVLLNYLSSELVIKVISTPIYKYYKKSSGVSSEDPRILVECLNYIFNSFNLPSYNVIDRK